ncbi:MAG TPA: hypothetical protein VK922_11175 [Gemmatimonadaceae bacterium]|nr:hypothetical protein [Gemmatimonadaceae bacterium]
MTGRTRSFGAACLAAALLLSGCSDSTGPGAPFDPAHAEADVAALGAVMGSPQLEAFAAMSAYFNLGGASLATVSSARAMLSSGGASAGTARRMALAAAEGLALKATGSAAPSLAVLPPSVFGKTFVFDEQAGTYVESDRTGAPANGVRFIIYAVDPFTYEPVVDTEIGHADLIDTSVGSQTTAGMRVLLVGGGTTYLDYAFIARGTQNAVTLGVNGYLTDGTTRLNFDIDASLSFTEEDLAIDVDFSFAVPSRQFSVAGSIDGLAGSTGGLGQVALTITSGGTRIRFQISSDDTTLNATVYVNNAIFATISGDPSDPVVLGAGGAELTQEEMDALVELFLIVDGVFEFFGTLLAPVNAATGGSGLP